MRNEKLRGVFEELGFDYVRSVITTGNILFDSSSAALRGFETQIEEALPKRLGFSSTTIIRSRKELQDLVDSARLKRLTRAYEKDLDLTFFKRKARVKPLLPYRPDDGDYTIHALDDRTVCSVVDPRGSSKTPDYMRWIEKQFGKEVTTRTYRTVERILKMLKES
jgi:uncharacterized protein (DUF1697 family)